MKWNPKDPGQLIGVPGKGFIKATDFNQEDLDSLIARAKRRGIDVHMFLLGVGLVPAQPQLELIDDEQHEVIEDLNNFQSEEPVKRKRRTKAEMEADK